MPRELTPLRKRFVNEYLKDLNGTRAAIAAGYSKESARFIASELLTFPNVQKKIQAEKKKREKRTEISADKVLKELARLAFSNIKDIASWNSEGVTCIDSDEIPREVAGAIVEISCSENWGDTSGSKKVKVKLASKQKALETLAQHLGLLDVRSVETPNDDDLDRMSRSERIRRAAERVRDRR